MNKSELLQSLWKEIKRRDLSHEDIAQIFEDYQDAVAEISKAGDNYSAAVLHSHEDFPDLQRLVGRKHDEVLKGRLSDAIGTLKKKIEAIESLPVNPDDRTEAAVEPETHIRNKPTLRME